MTRRTLAPTLLVAILLLGSTSLAMAREREPGDDRGQGQEVQLLDDRGVVREPEIFDDRGVDQVVPVVDDHGTDG